MNSVTETIDATIRRDERDSGQRTDAPAWQIVGALLSGRGWVRELLARVALDERDFECVGELYAWQFYSALMAECPVEAAMPDIDDREPGDTLDMIDRASLWTGRERWDATGVSSADASLDDLSDETPVRVPTEFVARVASQWRFCQDDYSRAAADGLIADARALRIRRCAIDRRFALALKSTHEVEGAYADAAA